MLRYADPTQYALGVLLRPFCVRIPGCPPMHCRQGAPHSEACSPRRTLNRRRRPSRAKLSSPLTTRKWWPPRPKQPCAHIFGHTRPHTDPQTRMRARTHAWSRKHAHSTFMCASATQGDVENGDGGYADLVFLTSARETAEEEVSERGSSKGCTQARTHTYIHTFVDT